MLVLTRKLTESVMIGDDVEVTVAQISGGQVKLAISAPRSVKLYRTEIWRERQRAAQDAAATPRKGAA